MASKKNKYQKKNNPKNIHNKPVEQNNKAQNATIQKQDWISTSTTKFALLFIFIVTVFAFSPGLKNQFTNWDDNRYVVENPVIHDINSENIHRIFLGDYKYHMGNYHPFTILSLAIDYQIGKLNPQVYILHNLFLHLLNTFLVFVLLKLLFRKNSIALVATALFAVSTLHVESVTWISERKDMLYSFYYLASAIGYVYYVLKNNSIYIIVSFLFFGISLLAKGQAVSLAVTLVAIDYLMNRKLSSIRVILEKVPYFVLALIMGIVAIKAQSAGEALQDIGHYSFFSRILVGGYGFSQYIFKLFVPYQLSAIYPYPDIINKTIPGYFAFFLIPAFAYVSALVYFFKKNNKEAVFAMAFYAINIALLLQFIPVGSAIMADRYSYIPSIGIYLAVGILYYWLSVNKKQFLTPALVLFGVVFIALLSATYVRTQVWSDAYTLWDDTTKKSPKAVVAWNNLGSTKDKMGKKQEAILDFSKAIAYKPDYVHAFYNRGTAYKDLKNYQEALNDFEYALKLDSNFAEAYHNRGIVYDAQGNIEQAIVDFSKALQLRPKDDKVLVNRGVSYGRYGKFDLALADFNAAIQIQPNNPTAFSNRGLAYDFLKKYDLALTDYTQAIKLDPKFETAYNNRALVRRKTGDYEGAVQDFSNYIALKPENPDPYYFRGLDQIRIGNTKAGCADLQQALKMGVKNAQKALDKYCKN